MTGVQSSQEIELGDIRELAGELDGIISKGSISNQNSLARSRSNSPSLGSTDTDEVRSYVLDDIRRVRDEKTGVTRPPLPESSTSIGGEIVAERRHSEPLNNSSSGACHISQGNLPSITAEFQSPGGALLPSYPHQTPVKKDSIATASIGTRSFDKNSPGMRSIIRDSPGAGSVDVRSILNDIVNPTSDVDAANALLAVAPTLDSLRDHLSAHLSAQQFVVRGDDGSMSSSHENQSVKSKKSLGSRSQGSFLSSGSQRSKRIPTSYGVAALTMPKRGRKPGPDLPRSPKTIPRPERPPIMIQIEPGSGQEKGINSDADDIDDDDELNPDVGDVVANDNAACEANVEYSRRVRCASADGIETKPDGDEIHTEYSNRARSTSADGIEIKPDRDGDYVDYSHPLNEPLAQLSALVLGTGTRRKSGASTSSRDIDSRPNREMNLNQEAEGFDVPLGHGFRSKTPDSRRSSATSASFDMPRGHRLRSKNADGSQQSAASSRSGSQDSHTHASSLLVECEAKKGDAKKTRRKKRDLPDNLRIGVMELPGGQGLQKTKQPEREGKTNQFANPKSQEIVSKRPEVHVFPTEALGEKLIPPKEVIKTPVYKDDRPVLKPAPVKNSRYVGQISPNDTLTPGSRSTSSSRYTSGSSLTRKTRSPMSSTGSPVDYKPGGMYDQHFLTPGTSPGFVRSRNNDRAKLSSELKQAFQARTHGRSPRPSPGGLIVSPGLLGEESSIRSRRSHRSHRSQRSKESYGSATNSSGGSMRPPMVLRVPSTTDHSRRPRNGDAKREGSSREHATRSATSRHDMRKRITDEGLYRVEELRQLSSRKLIVNTDDNDKLKVSTSKSESRSYHRNGIPNMISFDAAAASGRISPYGAKDDKQIDLNELAAKLANYDIQDGTSRETKYLSRPATSRKFGR